MAPPLRLDRPDCRAAETRGQQPVIACRHSSALQMAEHKRARLFASDLLDLERHAAGDPPEATLLARHGRSHFGFDSSLWDRAFGHDDDGEMATGFVARDDFFADL